MLLSISYLPTDNENETRDFALNDAQANEIGVFTGKSPRQAALRQPKRETTQIKTP